MPANCNKVPRMAQIIPVDMFDYVVFGATGDLTLRKLLPALYYRYRDKQMTSGSRIIAAARSDHDDPGYRRMATDALNHFVSHVDLDDTTVNAFLESVFYVRIDGTSADGWDGLVGLLTTFPDRIRVFYMATSPDLYDPICRNILAHGLVSKNSRVVLEKPIGHDLASAQIINQQVGAIFSEQQTYRIDHYLGKETVQNLLALRFANSIFERLWNADVIDHVQVTVAETVGVESRAGYYDKSGQLRDMVQNHLLQLVCLLAMESPISLAADAVRDEKLKVLRALKPIAPHEIGHVTVRGQYAAGAIAGKSVASYLSDLGHESATETFVALKAEIRSWRWAGVPFYLRTGKRLAEKVSEVVIQFRAVPFSIFPRDVVDFQPNRLVMRLQPDEGIRLEMMVKDPGPGGMRLRATRLNISFEEAFNTRYPDAYERLLMDAVRGNQTLFMRRDEVEAAWKWVEPIQTAWANTAEQPRLYPSGSWGPTSAIALIERDGRTWHEEFN
jgi:glucose-6-phosphate 1-dehydrogenase